MIRFLSRFKLYRFFLQTFLPSFSFYSRITSIKRGDVKASLERGDVILTRSRFNLTSIFIPGLYSHACVFDGHNVVEMVSSGYRAIDIDDLLTHTDYIQVLRLKEGLNYFIEQVLSREGASYDIAFRPDNKNLYCTELVVESLPFSVEKKMWMPDDLLELGFERVLKI